MPADGPGHDCPHKLIFSHADRLTTLPPGYGSCHHGTPPVNRPEGR